MLDTGDNRLSRFTREIVCFKKADLSDETRGRRNYWFLASKAIRNNRYIDVEEKELESIYTSSIEANGFGNV